MASGEKFLGGYDQKTQPEDTDLLIGYDVTNSKTKNFKFSGIWNWIKAKLSTAAFCAVVNNLTTTTDGNVLDARQGKKLNDALTNLSTLVGSTDISAIGGGTLTGAISVLNSKPIPKSVLSGNNAEISFYINDVQKRIIISANKKEIGYFDYVSTK